MEQTLWDAIVIGGGPGGTSAASFLAKSGASVLLLEKEVFPRFHIGESLLPYNQAIFRELGLVDTLQSAGFIPKHGAQFHVGNGSKHLRFAFAQGRLTREKQAIQVERSAFDHLLLKHAERLGVKVLQGHAVSRFQCHAEDGRIEVAATSAQGAPIAYQAKFLIDASGRGNLTGNQEGQRRIHPRLKKLALFGHYEGVALDEGPASGDTIIIRLQDRWFWIIPITPLKTSVGCVLDKETYQRIGKSPAMAMEEILGQCALMRERMSQAVPVAPIQTTSDFSYTNQRFVGPRLLRVGDAAAFMDPIFSAGVYLAMHSGKLAAQTVSDALRTGRHDARAFNAYEKKIRRAMAVYWTMVEHFYTTPFMEILLEPREKWNLPAAVNAVLAGELEGGWSMRWRMRLFFWVIRVQKFLPLVPRITFADPPSARLSHRPVRKAPEGPQSGADPASAPKHTVL